MQENVNPLRLRYWLGEVDPRPLALFRIAFGLVLLHDLFDYAFNLRAFLTDTGFLPRGAQAVPYAWSIFNLVGSTSGVAMVFALGVLVVLAFTLGFHTRAMTVLTWAFITSLHNRNLYVLDGGDDLTRIFLFLSMFTDLGLAYSLDVRLGRKSRGPAPALGMRFLELHVALLYFVAARLKFRQGWLTRNAIYDVLQLDGFIRPLGSLLLKFPTACRALGLLTLGLEWSYAFLALSPWKVRNTRLLAIMAAGAVQLGILFTMRVGIFTEAALVANAVLIPPEVIDLVEAWIRTRRGTVQVAAESSPPKPGAAFRAIGPARVIASAALALWLIGDAWGSFVGSHLAEPELLAAPRRWLSLSQPFGLFDVRYDIFHWQALGQRADQPPGHLVEVLSVAAPGMLGEPGSRYSRWYKFACKERERPYRLPEFGAYLCRAYQERAGPLLDFTLSQSLTPPAAPGEAAAPPQFRERFHQVCTPLGR